jgi:hypothetical protein
LAGVSAFAALDSLTWTVFWPPLFLEDAAFEEPFEWLPLLEEAAFEEPFEWLPLFGEAAFDGPFEGPDEAAPMIGDARVNASASATIHRAVAERCRVIAVHLASG